MKLMDILKEVERKHSAGCAMVFFDFKVLSDIHSMIDADDVYDEDGYGLEDEPHCTLLYGFDDDVHVDDIEPIIDRFKFRPLKLTNISVFENADYDVLKFDVQGDYLYKINKDLTKLPYETSFPVYHPHSTVAYLKPGLGEKYVKKIGENAKFTVIPQFVKFTHPFDDDVIIKIK